MKAAVFRSLLVTGLFAYLLLMPRYFWVTLLLLLLFLSWIWFSTSTKRFRW